jgi:erythromycin esterase-like protein
VLRVPIGCSTLRLTSVSIEIPAPLISVDRDDRRGLADALADRIGQLPRRPRLLGLGEPMHGVDEFPRLRNALFEALVDRAGFSRVALETSAWHGRAVDEYVRGGDADEDAVMATGFTHGWGGFPANRELVRWLREQNRRRAPDMQLRFAGFDAPVEMQAAPSPRPMLRLLHDFLSARAEVPPWSMIDELIGPDEPWVDPAAAMEAAHSIGSEPRVRDLRAVTDDLRRTLDIAVPRLRHEIGSDELADVVLAGRTAAGLLAYHAAMARDTEHRWQHLSALRDAMMAENLRAIADRGPTLVFAQNEHLRTGTAQLAFGPATLHWQPVGAHVAGPDYHVIACAFGAAEDHDIAEPAADTIEGALYRALPPGNHLLPAADLQAVRARCTTRVSPNYAYLPLDDTILGQVDELLFLREVG